MPIRSLAALVLALAAVPASSQEPQTVYFTNVIGRFALVDGERDENPSLGVRLRYSGPDSSFADVFMYPGPDLDTACALACAKQLMAQEIEAYRAGFKQSIANGNYQSIDLVNQAPLPPGPSDQWTLGHKVETRVVRDGVTMRSDFTLYYLRGVRVKVRQTYVPSPELSAHMATFLRQVVPRSLQPPRPLGEPTRENILSLIAGEWDWSSANGICGEERQRIAVAPDGQSFTITFANDTSVTLYQIEAVGPGVLTDAPFTVRARIVDETRTSVSGRTVGWDLALANYDTFGWHRSDWEEDARTNAVFRCP